MANFSKRQGTPGFLGETTKIVAFAERWGMKTDTNEASTGTRYIRIWNEEEEITVRIANHGAVYEGDYYRFDPEVDGRESIKKWIRANGTNPRKPRTYLDYPIETLSDGNELWRLKNGKKAIVKESDKMESRRTRRVKFTIID